MVKGRMLNVIKYLEKHRETGYRQIAEAMDETTRAIRYDIDKINDELSLQKLPLIEKLPKGSLKYRKILIYPYFLRTMNLFSPQKNESRFSA
ncbi:MAG: hypothetical protein ACLUTO_04165 [Anaerostipes sp.]